MVDTAIGGSLNVGEASVGALIALKASIDGLNGNVEKLRALYLRAEQNYQARNQNFVPLFGSATSSAGSTPLTIDLGGPNHGRLWEVRQLVIGGATWASVVAGNGIISIAPSAPPGGTPGLAGIQDQATTLPSIAFYSAAQFRVRNPNRVFVTIISPTATTLYEAAGDAYDMADLPATGVFNS
jgi:hypothetical protein